MASEKVPKRKIPEDRLATEHLANERTFLAWVRTSIAVISLGFVMARFIPELRQPRVGLGGPNPPLNGGPYIPMGIGIMAFGALITILAAWRYDRVNRDIERGEVSVDRWLVVLVTCLVALLAAGTSVYLVLAPR